ncbi:MAG: methyltransferase domain-containing protein [Planctomycetota bacterium]
MESSTESEYVLRRGDDGAQRLRLLSRVKWPSTETLLRRAGLTRRMRCLDVGCGIGEVTLQMARMVAPDGEAVGVDSDEAYVLWARSEAVRRRLNASFHRADALHLDEESAYDFVYARYLLTHLSEPRRALDRMIRAARPGAVIAVEDVDFPGHICFPACPAFLRYLELYQAVVRRNGGDPAIGPRLYALFLESGLQQAQVDIAQPTFSEGEGKLVAQVTMEHVREPVIRAELASHAEIDAILSELDRFVRNPKTIMSIARTFQVWGRKPSP